MTRINLIHPSKLTDKHLLAEYRELPRVSALAWGYYEREVKSAPYNKDRSPNFTIGVHPIQYTLGTGHVKFFYNKGEWLRYRFEDEIVPEMQRRGFKTSYISYRPHPDGMNANWQPSSDDIEINKQRILERGGTV